MTAPDEAPLTPDQLEAALRQIGAARYHNLHPFHRRLHGGACTRVEVQAWALNRYHYQSRIPIKDATILARMDDPALRRAWRQRITDHDGEDQGGGSGGDAGAEDGGIARWLALTDAVGLDRAMVTAGRGVLPATRFAVGAYVHFCAERPLLDAIASSLTELFSPQVIGERVSGMLAHYDFIDGAALAYFTRRPPQAERDAAFALDYVRRHAVTPTDQQAVMAALVFKTDVLWAQLDALWHAYVAGHPPPGAWQPDDDAKVWT